MQAGVASLSLVGKITTSAGPDYLIAHGVSDAKAISGKVHEESRLFYSQDGATWSDLEPVTGDEDIARISGISGWLSGTPATTYTVEEPVPAPEPVEGEEAAEPPEPLTFEYTELQRLYLIAFSIIDEVFYVQPKGCTVVAADTTIRFVPSFSPLAYPDKLESYVHLKAVAPGQKSSELVSLAEDVRGTWALTFDSFTRVAVVRSLLWPGYAFYYSAATNTWGKMYSGPGYSNSDLVFML